MIALRVEPGVGAAPTFILLRHIAARHPGTHRLQLTTTGPAPRVLTLGTAWQYDASPDCLAALSELGHPKVT